MEEVWILFNEDKDVVRCFKNKDAAIQFSCTYFEEEELEFNEHYSYIEIYNITNDKFYLVGYIESYPVYEEA